MIFFLPYDLKQTNKQANKTTITTKSLLSLWNVLLISSMMIFRSCIFSESALLMMTKPNSGFFSLMVQRDGLDGEPTTPSRISLVNS